MIDGQAGKPYDQVLGYTTSADGKHLGYVATAGKHELVVIDGAEGPPYDTIDGHKRTGLVFSPDGQHVAYGATRDGAHFVVMDGNEGEPHQQFIDTESSTFSPDGRRLAYHTGYLPDTALFVDGQEDPRFAGANFITFSPDSQRLAIQFDLNRRIAVDGESSAVYDIATIPEFSPDSQHVGFVAIDGDDRFAVVDGKEGRHYESIDFMDHLFDAASMQPVYVASRGIQYFLVQGTKEGKPYDFICGLCAGHSTREGRLVAYPADHYSKEMVVVRAWRADRTTW